MTTTEKNKLIAEFLHGKNAVHPNQYHENWNELIEAVRKITYTSEFQETYKKNSVFWDEYCSIDISNVYKAVVEFILWHNTQNNPI
jgi:hypothetical protein